MQIFQHFQSNLKGIDSPPATLSLVAATPFWHTTPLATTNSSSPYRSNQYRLWISAARGTACSAYDDERNQSIADYPIHYNWDFGYCCSEDVDSGVLLFSPEVEIWNGTKKVIGQFLDWSQNFEKDHLIFCGDVLVATVTTLLTLDFLLLPMTGEDFLFITPLLFTTLSTQLLLVLCSIKTFFNSDVCKSVLTRRAPMGEQANILIIYYILKMRLVLNNKYLSSRSVEKIAFLIYFLANLVRASSSVNVRPWNVRKNKISIPETFSLQILSFQFLDMVVFELILY